LWKVGNAGFFSGIMGITSKSAQKSIDLLPLPPKPNTRQTANFKQIMEHNKGKWVAEDPH